MAQRPCRALHGTSRRPNGTWPAQPRRTHPLCRKHPPLRSLERPAPRAGVCSPPPGTTEYPQQKQQGWSVTCGLESQKMQVSLVSPEGRPQQCLREHWAHSKSPFCPRMLPFLQGGASPHAGLSLASLAGSSRMTGSPGSADGQRPAQGTGWRGPRRSGLCVPGGPGRWGGRFAPPGVPGFKVSPRVGRAAGLAVCVL